MTARAPTSIPAARSRIPLGNIGLWLGLLGIVLFAGVMSPGFLTPISLLNVVRQASVVGIASVGVTLVMITGGVDLSIGAVIVFGSVLAASLMDGEDANIPIACGAAMLMGLTVGLLNGIILSRWKVPAFILTLGMATVISGVTQLYTGGTAAGEVAPAFRQVVNGRIGVVPVLAIVFLAVIVIGLVIQDRTTLGRRIYLVGANARAARLSGVPVDRTRVAVFALSGLGAAVAGLALLARSGVSSNFAGQGFEFDALAAVVLGGTTFRGGRGGIGGSIAGVLILATSFNLVNILGLPFNMELLVKGGIIFGVAALQVASQRKEGNL
ncbi:MAG: ABC transporter permease [Chloroflexi bacterium]|nr:ABC transporter permease [Chloroflexota bacterium]